MSRQADVLPEAGLSSDSTIDVSLSPGIEPSPQYPTSSIAGWQSTEVPGDQMEHNDDQYANFILFVMK